MTTINYKCEVCDVAFGNKKSNFAKHINSKRHFEKVSGDNMSDTSDITEATEYCTLSALTQSRNP